MEESEVKQGKRVSLVRNPNKTGLLTGEITHMGNRTYITVQFPDGIMERELSSLQLVENVITKPIDDLRNSNFGSLKELNESITQKRLGGKLANVIYSMESTNTDYYAYQFKPVLNMLSSPCDGMLIADEVGLGKTIEAGLIWTELRQREEAARLLVVCPAVLREKWRDELSNRFGIKAESADRNEVLDTLKRYEEQKIHDFALVTSIQGIRPRYSADEESSQDKVDPLTEYLRNKANTELFDLTVIDEAHYMKNPSTKNHELGKLLRETSKWFLLLSATPIQLRSDDLYHLLSLIDEQYFPNKDSFKNYLEANEPVLEARNILAQPNPSAKDVIVELNKIARHRLFKGNRQIQHLLKEINASSELTPLLRAKYQNQLERTNLFWHVISRTRRRDVRDRTAVRREVPQRITPSDPEKSIYNTISASIRAWAEANDVSQGFILAGPQRQMSSSIPATVRYWQRKESERQDELNEGEFNEELESKEELISEESEMKFLEFVTNRTLDLDYSYRELKSSDTKFEKLSSLLQQHLKENPEKKAIIFSTYRATVDYLVERFEEMGIKVISMKGGSDYSKQDLVEQFRNQKEIRLLICTEVMSEGVDLQFTNMVVNYDLPWNPMKIEQRIGRVDRIGQEEDRIIIWNFLHADTIDDRIYQRLLDRIGIFENALGGLEHIIGDVLGTLTNRLLTEDLTIEEQEEVIDRGRVAIENTKQLEDQVESEASTLMAHGQYILNEVEASKELERFVTDRDLMSYVVTFFEISYPGTHIHFLDEGEEGFSYELGLAHKARIDFQDHIIKFRLKRTGIQREGKYKVLFKNKTGINKRGFEIINQFHPLIHFINHKLLEKRQDSRLAPARVKLRGGNVSKGLYLFMIHRWEFTGIRDREELKYCLVNTESKEIIGREESEIIINKALQQGDDQMSANLSPIDQTLSEECFAEADHYLTNEFNEYVESIERENQDRIDAQERSLKDNMEKQISSRKQAIETRKETARRKGTKPNIAIEEGRIRNIEARFAEKLVELDKAKDLGSDFEILAFGWLYCD